MSTIDKKKQHTKYLWLDLEMTGLNVEHERIIEAKTAPEVVVNIRL